MFTDLNAPLRADADFRDQDNDPEHHHGVSILENLPIDMVEDFPHDFLHIYALGVIRKKLVTWTVEGDFKLSPLRIRRLNTQLLACKPYTPREFARKPRSVKELGRWKGTELSQFGLYTGVVALKNVLSEEQYTHFLTLFVAIRILASPGLCETHWEFAHSLLVNYVENGIVLYEESFITHNVHGLIHIAREVLRFGHMLRYSAYAFENFMQFFKRLMRKSSHPLQQLVRRMIEIEKNLIPDEVDVPDAYYLMKCEHFDGPLVGNFVGVQYKKVFMGKRVLTVLRYEQGNCCVMLDDRTIVLIENIVERDGEPYIIGKSYEDVSDLFVLPSEIPFHSSVLDIFKVSKISETLSIWPLSRVLRKCYRAPYINESFAILPLIDENLSF